MSAGSQDYRIIPNNNPPYVSNNKANKIIIHLCADIGSDSKPYRDAGYDVRCIGKDIG